MVEVLLQYMFGIEFIVSAAAVLECILFRGVLRLHFLLRGVFLCYVYSVILVANIPQVHVKQ